MISVVMPAHNEAGYLTPAVEMVVSALRSSGRDFEVIVSENGSTDATPAEAATLDSTYAEVKVLRAPRADYGLALRAGFLEAAGEFVVNFDVDYVDIDFLDRALARMRGGDAVIVVGSKRTAGADDQRNIGRRAVTAAFATVLRLGFGLRISDTHGLKLLRRPPLLPLVNRCRFGADLFDTELVIRAERCGLRVEEIPVAVRETRPPRTSIARRIPRTVGQLLRLRVAMSRFEPASGAAGEPQPR